MPILKKIAIACLLVAFIWLAGFSAFAFTAIDMRSKHDEETADAIIILTGGADRIREGLSLFAAGKASHLFISGVHPDVTRDEILSLWTGDNTLPPCCVALGKKATTTKENAKESIEWAKDNDITSFFLVTSNYHTPRAMREFRAVFPDIKIYAYPIDQNDLPHGDKRIWALLFSEYHKFLIRSVQLLFA